MADVLVVTGLFAGFLGQLAIGYVAVTATRGWWPARRRGVAGRWRRVGAWLLLAAFLVVASIPLLDRRLF